jgi:hypothetical protein
VARQNIKAEHMMEQNHSSRGWEAKERKDAFQQVVGKFIKGTSPKKTLKISH